MVKVAEAPQDRSYVATFDAAGAATIEVTTWRDPWLISQVSTDYPTAPAGCICAVRKRGQLITPMIAAADVAAGDPPIVLAVGETMTVEWTGGTPTEQAKALVIYQRMEY